MVFGQMVFGPLSDAYGRRPALLLGLAIYCAGIIIALLAKSYDQIVLGRVIKGFGVSGPKIICREVLRDRFEGAVMARVMSLVFSVFTLVPMLTPAIGKIVLHLSGWRWMFALYVATAALARL